MSDGGGTLVLMCRECSHERPFSSPACMGNIINTMMNVLGAEKVEFRNHLTSTLNRRDMAFFRGAMELLETASGMAMRDPGHSECMTCTYNPGALFRTLGTHFLEDVDGFGSTLATYAEGILAFRGHRKDCGPCLRKTAEDLNHIAVSYMGLISSRGV